MTHTPKAYRAQRTDKFGDAWVYEYDPNLDQEPRGTVSSSDMDWKEYPVIRGFTFGLELSDEDVAWLWASWREATNLHGDPGIYGPDTGSDVPGPETFCPLCLRFQTEFEVHHVTWRMDGGSDHGANLLPLCKSCHALTSHGGGEDRERRDRAAHYHQAACHGARYLYNASAERRETFERIWPGNLRNRSRSDRLRLGRFIKNNHEALYIYYRETAFERMPRYDLLTLELHDGDTKQFTRDRKEYLRKWKSRDA